MVSFLIFYHITFGNLTTLHVLIFLINFKSFYIYIYINLNKNTYTIKIVGLKDLGTPTHLISSPRPTPRSKKCLRTDGENPDLQVVRPRIIISSAGHNLGREKRNVTRGSPPEDRERDSSPYGLAIGGWWRDNPRRSHHLRIKIHTANTLTPLMWI